MPCPNPLMNVVKIMTGYTKVSERKNPRNEWSFNPMFKAGKIMAIMKGRFSREEYPIDLMFPIRYT